MRRLSLLLAMGTALALAADFSGYYAANLREAASELLLRPNGTFQWALSMGAADFTAQGTWRADGDSVILNSSTSAAKPFRLLSSSAGKGPEILVRVRGLNGRGVPNIDVELATDRGPLQARTDSSGEARFPKTNPAKTATFDIPVYSFRSEALPLNAAHTEFTFEVNGDAITQVVFKNERLAAKGAALVMRHFPEQVIVFEKE